MQISSAPPGTKMSGAAVVPEIDFIVGTGEEWQNSTIDASNKTLDLNNNYFMQFSIFYLHINNLLPPIIEVIVSITCIIVYKIYIILIFRLVRLNQNSNFENRTEPKFYSVKTKNRNNRIFKKIQNRTEPKLYGSVRLFRSGSVLLTPKGGYQMLILFVV